MNGTSDGVLMQMGLNVLNVDQIHLWMRREISDLLIFRTATYGLCIQLLVADFIKYGTATTHKWFTQRSMGSWSSKLMLLQLI